MADWCFIYPCDKMSLPSRKII